MITQEKFNFIISLKCVQVNSLNINRNSLKEKLDLSKNCVFFLFFLIIAGSLESAN